MVKVSHGKFIAPCSSKMIERIGKRVEYENKNCGNNYNDTMDTEEGRFHVVYCIYENQNDEDGIEIYVVKITRATREKKRKID